MVIDSHALVWWLEETPRLSKKVAGIFLRGPDLTIPLVIAPVTFWEMRLKERRGRFLPKRAVPEWPALFAKIPWIEIVDTDSSIWIAAANLDWSHRDPADRIIAATALARGVPVLSKDRVFHSDGCPVEAIW